MMLKCILISLSFTVAGLIPQIQAQGQSQKDCANQDTAQSITNKIKGEKPNVSYSKQLKKSINLSDVQSLQIDSLTQLRNQIFNDMRGQKMESDERRRLMAEQKEINRKIYAVLTDEQRYKLEKERQKKREELMKKYSKNYSKTK